MEIVDFDNLRQIVINDNQIQLKYLTSPNCQIKLKIYNKISIKPIKIGSKDCYKCSLNLKQKDPSGIVSCSKAHSATGEKPTKHYFIDKNEIDEVFENFSQSVDKYGNIFNEPEMKQINQPGLPFSAPDTVPNFIRDALKQIKNLNPDLNVKLDASGDIVVNEINLDDF